MNVILRKWYWRNLILIIEKSMRLYSWIQLKELKWCCDTGTCILSPDLLPFGAQDTIILNQYHITFLLERFSQWYFLNSLIIESSHYAVLPIKDIIFQQTMHKLQYQSALSIDETEMTIRLPPLTYRHFQKKWDSGRNPDSCEVEWWPWTCTLTTTHTHTHNTILLESRPNTG